MLPRGLIVSCQIPGESPLDGVVSTTALARAAVAEGAVAIRAEGFLSIKEIKAAVSVPVIGLIKTMAKSSGVYINPTLDEGELASAAGIRILATTLAGYTDTSKAALPDLKLVTELVALNIGPVIAEGGYRNLQDCKAAFAAGAHAICIGGAITDPWNSTKYFVAGLVGHDAK